MKSTRIVKSPPIRTNKTKKHRASRYLLLPVYCSNTIPWRYLTLQYIKYTKYQRNVYDNSTPCPGHTPNKYLYRLHIHTVGTTYGGIIHTRNWHVSLYTKKNIKYKESKGNVVWHFSISLVLRITSTCTSTYHKILGISLRARYRRHVVSPSYRSATLEKNLLPFFLPSHTYILRTDF